jgi:succinate dehydrogenase / fumarate reductase, cytochrome b subunit
MASSRLLTFYRSQVGRKFITGLTGVALMGFITGHLIGNFLLLGDGTAFNIYGHRLESLGVILYAIEITLIVITLFHAIIGISIAMEKARARPMGYDKHVSRGNESRMTRASKSMIWSGLILLIFIVFHVITMKYGPYYETTVEGIVVRDLYKLTVETFKNPLYVIGYTVVMLWLWTHLRHGFWSAVQSLTLMSPRNEKTIRFAGKIYAALMGFGFLFLPLWIYFVK